MVDPASVLFTGGSGLLGRALRALLPAAHFPSRAEFDVTSGEGMEAFVRERRIGTVVHAAAFTSPPKIDAEPMRALEVNIVGTANVVRLAARLGARLVYVSTDYVFRGDQGRYREEDPVAPVNKYAWSKLGGECAVRLYDRALIVRTSFGADVFPYPKAFTDQYTSRQGVSAFAQALVRLIDSPATGVLHVGGPRRSVHEYAKSLDPLRPIGELSIRDVPFAVPVDTSLDSTRHALLLEQLAREEIP
jgi:dTDP-4-dehydrorhamnose reductase